MYVYYSMLDSSKPPTIEVTRMFSRKKVLTLNQRKVRK